MQQTLIADQQQSIFLKVGLTGSDIGEERRTPANVSIVLDRSVSMNDKKMAQAKEAASIAISMLDDRDIVSIVTYSDTVSVIDAVKQISVEVSEEAIILRDAGKVEEAQALLQKNTEYLFGAASALESEELLPLGSVNSLDAPKYEKELRKIPGSLKLFVLCIMPTTDMNREPFTLWS